MTREVVSVVRGLGWVTLAGVLGCQFKLEVQECTLSCESSSDCPDGYKCKSNFCARAEATPMCGPAMTTGDAGRGQPGAPTNDVQLPAPRRVEQLAAGSDHNCVLLDNGGVRCWGSNGEPACAALGLPRDPNIPDEELHIGDDKDEFPSTMGYVQIGPRVKALELGSCFSCALFETGGVRCWGKNDRGQLGYGHDRTIGDDEQPQAAGYYVDTGGIAVVELAAGTAHVCARTETGDVMCWGEGQYGQLGYGSVDHIGDDEHPAIAGFVALGGPARQLAAGLHHSCALLEGGAVRCWGQNARGSLGLGHPNPIGDDEDPETQPPVELGGPAEQICAGGNKSCALMADKTVRCWGRGADGRLGLGIDFAASDLGDDEHPTAFRPIELRAPAREIFCGGEHACALLEDGTLRCFGRNLEGELGYGHNRTIGDDEPPGREGPVPLPGAVRDVSLGRQHSCALVDAVGTPGVVCWGLNTQGQLGYGHRLYLGDDESLAEADFVSLF